MVSPAAVALMERNNREVRHSHPVPSPAVSRVDPQSASLAGPSAFAYLLGTSVLIFVQLSPCCLPTCSFWMSTTGFSVCIIPSAPSCGCVIYRFSLCVAACLLFLLSVLLFPGYVFTFFFSFFLPFLGHGISFFCTWDLSFPNGGSNPCPCGPCIGSLES